MNQCLFPVLDSKRGGLFAIRAVVIVNIVASRRGGAVLVRFRVAKTPAAQRAACPIAQVYTCELKIIANKPRATPRQPKATCSRVILILRIQFLDPGVITPPMVVLRSIPVGFPPPAPRWSSPLGRKFGSSRPTT